MDRETHRDTHRPIRAARRSPSPLGAARWARAPRPDLGVEAVRVRLDGAEAAADEPRLRVAKAAVAPATRRMQIDELSIAAPARCQCTDHMSKVAHRNRSVSPGSKSWGVDITHKTENHEEDT
eukprot:464080-Pleurochrysis_carterae.AAC.7